MTDTDAIFSQFWPSNNRPRTHVESDMMHDFEEQDDEVQNGSNLVQVTTPMTIVDYAAETVPLATLRHILVNMRDLLTIDANPVVHERLREYLTLAERKRLLVLLDGVKTYPIDTTLWLLGCMWHADKRFTLESGPRIKLVRFLHWLCGNNEAAHASDKEILTAAARRLGGRSPSFAELGKRFVHKNLCQNADCINPLHFVRHNAAPDVDDGESLASILPAISLNTEADAQRLRECGEHDWIAEKLSVRSRRTFGYSPLENMLEKSDLSAFSNLTMGWHESKDRSKHGDSEASQTTTLLID